MRDEAYGAPGRRGKPGARLSALRQHDRPVAQHQHPVAVLDQRLAPELPDQGALAFAARGSVGRRLQALDRRLGAPEDLREAAVLVRLSAHTESLAVSLP